METGPRSNQNRLTPEAQAAIDAASKREPEQIAPPHPSNVVQIAPETPEVDAPTGFHGSSFGGFNVEHGTLEWGPFKTPDEAAKWAIDTLSAGDDWIIRPLLDPASEQ